MAVTRRGLVDQVAHELQDRISLGEWAPGAKLPTEPALMELFGVGRSTIREAVRVLAHAGILSVRQGDGTYARPASAVSESLERRLRRAAILEVYEVRKALEVEAARLAAERRADADLEALSRELARRSAARKVGDTSAFVDADVAFHEAIAVASKNSVLADLYRAFAVALRNAIAAEVHDEALQGRDTSQQHRALLRAIAKRDPAGAARAVSSILDRTTKQLRALTAPGTGLDSGLGPRREPRPRRPGTGPRPPA